MSTSHAHSRPRTGGASEPTFVRVAGTPLEMGRQQGTQLRQACGQAARAVADCDAMRSLTSSLLPRPLASWLLRRRASTALRAQLQRYAPRHDERLRGLAEGAQLDRSWLDLVHSAESLARAPADVVPGCTSVAVGEGRAGEGVPILARNVDSPHFWSDSLIVRNSRPDAGLSSLEVTAAPMAGCLAGMNELGLAISYHPVRLREDGPAGVPIGLLIQDALERCATSAEATQFLGASARSGGGVLTLLDASGAGQVLELSPSQSAVLAARSGLTVAADHFCDEALTSRGLCHSERFPVTGAGRRGERILESSEHRQQRACELLEEAAVIDELRLATVMTDHGGRAGGEHSICRHGNRVSTACSVFFYPSRREARICAGPPCEGDRSFFSL